MALTIISQPAVITPAYNHNTFRINSNNYTLPNFKLSIELFVNGVSVNTSIIFPRPEGYMLYDPSKLVQQYLTPTLVPLSQTTFTKASANVTAYYSITITEEFDFDAIKDSISLNNNIFVWMAGAQWEEGKSLPTFTNKFLPISTNTNFSNAANLLGPLSYNDSLTFNLNKSYKVKSTDNRFISLFARDYTYSYYVTTLNVLTSSNKEYKKTLSVATQSLASNMIYTQPVGVNQLNLTTWTTTSIPVGLTSSITSSEDSYYFCYFTNETSGIKATHKPICFYIDECNKKERYTVKYQSANGGWWYIPFDMKSFKNETIKNTTMGNVVPYNYDYNYAGAKITSIDASGSIILNSGYIEDQDKINEIMDMIKSPTIYLIDSNDYYIPVIIKNATYNNANRKQDKLVLYSIEFIEAQNKNICV